MYMYLLCIRDCHSVPGKHPLPDKRLGVNVLVQTYAIYIAHAGQNHELCFSAYLGHYGSIGLSMTGSSREGGNQTRSST
jgi:hypothetical protein